MRTTRRELLGWLAAAGLWVGCGRPGGMEPPALDGGLPPDGPPPDGLLPLPDAGVPPDPPPPPPACADPFAGGEPLETLLFSGEGPAPLDTPIGSGLDGRLYTDLSTLTPETLVTPNERFYIRTRYPDQLDPAAPWRIAVGGLVQSPGELTLADLEPLVQPMGVHLLECSGNGGGAYFGLMSAADWAGVPLTRDAPLLTRFGVLPSATRLLVSGFDGHSQPSQRSIAGASWVFSFDELSRFGAFLATTMNGQPLPPDHGFPVRLFVPRWYGCACIKWVNEIRLVDDSEPATSQMQEFASRTHQTGVPKLARDYRSASMDQAAMPVRVEKWRVGEGLLYRVVGILWGGYELTTALSIQLGEGADFVPVDVCPPQSTNATWTLWSHPWSPPAPGSYRIRLRIDDATIPQRRLDIGFYDRTVEIAEV